MKNFVWISKHYLKKNFLNPANLLIIGLPLVFALTFFLMNNYILDMLGTDTAFFTGITIPMVLGFQFFGADLTADWLHHDLKGPTRSRLLASPVDQRVFFGGVILAGWLFNVFYGSIVVAITSIAFGEDWGNYGLVLLVLLCLSFITQLIGVLIFHFTKDEKSGTRISYVFGEIMMGVAILPFVTLPFVISPTILNHLPVNIGMNIIANYDLVYNLAVLFGIGIVLAIVVFLIGRRTNDNI